MSVSCSTSARKLSPFTLETSNLSNEWIKPLSRRQREDLETPESIGKVTTLSCPTSTYIKGSEWDSSM
jgi:hypothetical protein